MDAVAGAFAQEILTIYGVPGAALGFIIYFLWKNQRTPPPGPVPQDIHVQLQWIRDTLVRMMTIIEERKK
ncbi:MAG: hypothetical protein Tp118SUR00d2C21406231_21 [Prokaryotic dsDNA virus sp.]|nr:MAG: hypothetical protein Tp125DCM00d2C40298531_40 [Prokaryotic dsDNA virus sp.]QDP53141.1 MAG: hypothetical protein Tp118SUR00d2C21406231_21 [Prokaryotic dsDNA virus sp.]|tara:strand:+ start:16882 stop:17091 length:210 start_codon:yes stop_codon:yes gene_type:complete